MSIPFNGTRTRSHGVLSAIIKHLKSLSLKPVKSIDVKFDPFHSNASETRDFLFHITTPKILATNPRCSIKPLVVSDLSEAIITFNLSSGNKVVCKAGNLSSLNLLELYNKHITPLGPREPDIDPDSLPVEKKKKKKRNRMPPGRKRRGVIL